MDNGASSYRRFRDNGDERGLDAIIMEYKDGLMLYLTSIVGNIQTAEELTEDTFVLLGTKSRGSTAKVPSGHGSMRSGGISRWIGAEGICGCGQCRSGSRQRSQMQKQPSKRTI